MSFFSTGVEFVESAVSGLSTSVGDAVKKDTSQAFNQVRTGLANAVTLYGAGVTTELAQSIAPANAKPVAVPLTANQVAWLIAIAILLFVVFLKYAL